jgi:Ion channel
MSSTALGRFKEWRFVQLSIVFVVLMMLLPLLEQHLVLKALTSLLLLNALLVAISTHAGVRIRVVLWALWFTSLVGGIVEELPVVAAVGFAARCTAIVALAILVVICMSRTLRVAFRAERVTVDGIFASIVAYQLIGLFFAAVYTLLMIVDPTSMRGVHDPLNAPVGLVQIDMTYFSFVTLATLGYGDIVPLSSFARSIAVTEALVGQFYVAVVVALLIGAYLSRRQESG